MTPEPQAIRFRGVKHPTHPRIYVVGFWPEVIRVARSWLDPESLDGNMAHVEGEAGEETLRLTVDNGWAHYQRCGDEGPDVVLFRLVQGWQQIGRRKRLKGRPARSVVKE